MKKYIPAVAIVAIFILSSFISQEYSEALRENISQYGFFGILVYFIAVVLAVVVAPLTSIPLIPIIVSSWGVLTTVIVSIIGWTIGSMIAFWVARKFGVPVVEKMISITDNKKFFYKNISEEKMFWYLIFLRIIIPVDILSYMLGLFTNISWKLFIITTFIGVIPVIYVLAVFGSFPIKYQVIIALVGLSFLALIILIKKKSFPEALLK